jgi:hypothetical protein
LRVLSEESFKILLLRTSFQNALNSGLARLPKINSEKTSMAGRVRAVVRSQQLAARTK